MINDIFVRESDCLDPMNQPEKLDLLQQNSNDSEQCTNEDHHHDTKVLSSLSLLNHFMKHTTKEATITTTTTTTTTTSLAYTASRWMTWSITLSIIITHGLFLYGQIQPMWKLDHHESIDIWWNATTTTSQWAFHTLGLPHDLHFYFQSTNSSSSTQQSDLVFQDMTNASNTIQTFTYAFAIQELWEAKGMSAGMLISRVAAILLTLFSGIWPHVKLLSLQIM
jgi:hypothetical protein